MTDFQRLSGWPERARAVRLAGQEGTLQQAFCSMVAPVHCVRDEFEVLYCHVLQSFNRPIGNRSSQPREGRSHKSVFFFQSRDLHAQLEDRFRSTSIWRPIMSRKMSRGEPLVVGADLRPEAATVPAPGETTIIAPIVERMADRSVGKAAAPKTNFARA